jgi:carbamoyl-phosphate synthase large subunit
MGFRIYATEGTSRFLKERGIESTVVFKNFEKREPNAISLMRNGDIDLLINTPREHSGAIRDGHDMRRLAVELEIPYITTINGAEMAIGAIAAELKGDIGVKSMQEYHGLEF